MLNSRVEGKGSRAPRFVSLFSGCGGLDLGFIRAGFIPIVSVDIDQCALAVHQKNISGPVERLDLSSELPQIDTSVDVLLAGSPCQGFSTLGLRHVNDPRNGLLLTAAKAAVKLRPKVIIAENVLGALAGAHSSYWVQLRDRLRALGYKTHDLRLNSSDFGVPQHRHRIFLVAWRTDVLPSFSFEASPSRVLGDVLTRLDGTSNHDPIDLPPTTTDFKIACRIGPGQKLTNSRAGDSAVHTWNIPEVFGRTNANEREVLTQILRMRRQERRRDFGDADPVSTRRLNRQFGPEMIQTLVRKNYLRSIGTFHDLTHTFNGKYRRQDSRLPSRTVDTKFGEARQCLHPTENRAFTVREAARIQGFPDEFRFEGSLRQQFTLVGNAVPPPLAHAVALQALALLENA